MRGSGKVHVMVNKEVDKIVEGEGEGSDKENIIEDFKHNVVDRLP